MTNTQHFASLEQQYAAFLKSNRITIDSRKITHGDFFVALKGERFDGNVFAEAALQQGAAFVLLDNPNYLPTTPDPRYMLVADTLHALQQLACHHRCQLNLPIFALTGSNGKTTTKELLAAVLRTTFRTQSTEGNLNNHIGVPLTLLALKPDTQIAVIEMGANHQGEIDLLSNIALPNYGLITNIGKAHLEGFGGINGVRKGKGELFAHLQQRDGHAFVYADDPNIVQLAEQFSLSSTTTYGSHLSCDVYGEVVATEPFLHVRCYITDRSNRNITSIEIPTQLVGIYNLPNIVATVAVGNFFGISSALIQQAISSYNPQNNRSQKINWKNNTLIADFYNANPNSVEAALRSFAQLDAAQKMVVLGDMLELGEYAAEEHLKVVHQLQKMELDGGVILIGKQFMQAASGTSFLCFDTSESAREWFSQHLPTDTHILLKGSRGIAVEKILG